jgi:hypothetical protein
MVYSMLLDQVSAHFRSMNLLNEGVPTRQDGYEVVAASPKAASTASPGEGSTSPAVLSAYLLDSPRDGVEPTTRASHQSCLSFRFFFEISQIRRWLVLFGGHQEAVAAQYIHFLADGDQPRSFDAIVLTPRRTRI